MSEAARRLPEPNDFNDATVYGDVSEDILGRTVSMAFSLVGAKTAPGRWRNVAGEVRHVLNSWLTVHPEAKQKDGSCALAGSLVGFERKSTAVDSLCWIVLDLDCGEDPTTVRDRIWDLGWFAVLHTSWSDGKSTTDVKTEAVLRWLDNGATTATCEDVCNYLRSVKRYREPVLANAKLLGTVQTDDGFVFRVTHQPMTKLRAWFLLDKPFVFAERGATHAAGQAIWKNGYRGAAKLLDVATDRACLDPARLWYLPRHPAGAEWGCMVIAGEPVDFDSLAQVTEQDERRAGMGAFEQAADDMKAGNDTLYKTTGLSRFAAKFADRFDADTFMAEMQPEGDRGHASRGRTHRCPGDADHSNAGSEEDKGFFVVNSCDSESGGFVMSCRHDACAGRDRLVLLDLFCEQVSISDADELRRWIPATVEDDEEQRTTQTDDWTQADGFEAMCEGFHKVAGFVAVGESGKYVRLDPDGHNLSFTGLRAFERLHDHVRLPIKDKKSGATSLVPFLKLWPGSTQSAERKFHGLTFQPNRTPDQVFPLFNVWRSLGVQPAKGDWSLIRRHIWEVLANEDQVKFDMILGWMARHLQCLGDLDKKFPLSLVVKGEEGVGKSIVFDAYRQIFGRHGVTLSTPEDVLGEFNAHLAEAVFVLMEEAFFAGDPRIKGPLKHMLTGKDMLLQYKGIDKKTVPNYAQYIIVSNEELPVPIEPGSRRFYVVEASDRYKDKTSYFTALLAQIRQGGVAAMAHDLLRYKPPGDDWSFLYQSHHTIESDVMLARKLKPFERFMIRHVQEAISGDTQEKRFGNPFALSEDHASEWNLDEIRSAFVDSPELEDAPRHMRVDRDTDKTRLGEQLSAMLPSVGKRKSHGKIVRVFPPQAEMVVDLRRHRHRGYGALLDMLESGAE